MKRFAEARKAYDDECYQGGDADIKMGEKAGLKVPKIVKVSMMNYIKINQLV